MTFDGILHSFEFQNDSLWIGTSNRRTWTVKLIQTWREIFNSAFTQVSCFQSWIRTHQRSLHHPMLKCDSFFNLQAAASSPQVSRLSFSSGKMINYCFQGKHERDIKNAQDRRNIAPVLAPTVAQSSVTRSSAEDDDVQCKKLLVWQHRINNLCVNRNLFIFVHGKFFPRSTAALALSPRSELMCSYRMRHF